MNDTPQDTADWRVEELTEAEAAELDAGKAEAPSCQGGLTTSTGGFGDTAEDVTP
jgi:hypothetical protein